MIRLAVKSAYLGGQEAVTEQGQSPHALGADIAQRNAPVLMTGEEYMASLRDGRVVYYRGERIADVTAHPATKGAVSQVAAIYDAQHTPGTRDILTYTDEEGHLVSMAWMIPRSREDLIRRREMAEYMRARIHPSSPTDQGHS